MARGFSAKERRKMNNAIRWGSDLEAGRERAAREKKHVFLDFFNPQ